MNIDISEEAGVRYLHFGSDWVQGAMRIARPFSLELDYTREMMLPLLLRPDDWPQRVLLIGLGAGSLCKFLWRYRPEAKLTVVEIEPRVEAAARQFFKLPDDPQRIRIHFADGADFMIQSKQRYDLILVDGFDSNARAGRLDSLPFYLDCKARLAKEGLLCVNLLSRRKNFHHNIKQIKTAFDDQVISFPSRDEGNAIAVASLVTDFNTIPLGVFPKTALHFLQSDSKLHGVSPAPSNSGLKTFSELQAAAQNLRQSTHLNLLPMLANLAASGHLKDGILQL
ncbi:MAG: fused MFS/spermidine synthase [Rugosibacter sp.]|nr:fused MFS/spermidine synthase [Rugosibacter sp.]